MIEFTKKDLLLILNTYQNYFNDFNNISEDDLTNIYIEIETEDMKKTTANELINTYIKNLK
jgi:hypothetical protein